MSKDIKKERTESLLQELLSEALTQLSDTRLNSLSVTEVVCSRGKYNAEVYILFDSQDKREHQQILKLLHKAEGTLREYILSTSNWFRCPKLSFKIDQSLGRVNTLEKIFEKIKKDKM